MHQNRLFLSFVLAATVLAGCGVRTGLEIHADGGDGGTRDTGGRDAIVTDAPWDGGGCTTDRECDDGQACNGVEVCAAGRCQRGAPLDCGDGISCTNDQCVEGAGCVSRPDDSLCPPGQRCQSFTGCVPVAGGCRSDLDCDDHLVCNGIERCDVGSGTCFAGEPMFCGDGISCTDDACIEGFGCNHQANSAECPIGQICNLAAGCVTLSCGPTGSCDDGDPCNGVEFCSADGRCNAGSPLRCDDGNACTLDFCITGAGCASSTTAEICGDGVDNDCNMLVDCADPSCFGTPRCGCMPTGPFEAACLDARDDDCDGLVDCLDPDCNGRPECGGICTPRAPIEVVCRDGIDDDCDGLFDCADPDCFGRVECGPSDAGVCSAPELCHDGIDQDCNGLTDCADPFCLMTDPTCSPTCVPTSRFERRCNDGLDDDCNGLVDCADRACMGRPSCGPADAGIDGSIVSDGGGPTTNEIGIAACTNGLDDDRDGRPDCADPDCRPFGPGAECCNGVDDNGDGTVDEFTCRCFDNSFCGSVGSLDQVCWLNSFSVCAPRCNFYGGNSFCAMLVPSSPTCNMMTGECE